MLHKKTRFLLKPLAVCVGIGFAATNVAAANAPAPNNNNQSVPFIGPFSHVPLHLQLLINSSGSGAKPNVILQVDNSGSMERSIDNVEYDKNRYKYPNYHPESRIEITRRALLRLLGNPKYRDTVNWNLTTLIDLTHGDWKEGELWIKHTRKFLENKVPFARDPAELERLIGNKKVFFPVGLTPSTERYLDSITILRKEIEKLTTLQCQKSYVILFSDGNQASTSNIPMEREKGLGNYINTGFIINSNARPVDGSGFQTMFFAQKYPYVFKHPNPRKFQAISGGLNDPDNFLTYDQYDPTKKGWSWYFSPFTSTQGNTGSLYFWPNRSKSLKFFAEIMHNDDLNKTVPGKQNIQTFTIAFGKEDGGAEKYLLGGSVSDNPKLNGRVLSARNEKELDDAFEQIFKNIATESRFTPPASFASVAPTLSREDLNRKVPNMAATVQLNLESGSSEIRFYNVSGGDKQFNVDKAGTFRRPSFGNRKFIINAGGADNKVSWLESFQGSNDYFGIPNNGKNANEWRRSMIPWLMRTTADGSLNAQNNAIQYRVRPQGNPDKRSMGDVISTPIEAYGPVEYNRQKYLVTAANDGMVYLFRSENNNTHPYDLKLNYIPAGMERESTDDTVAKHFKHIVNPKYVVDSLKNPHRYMINGGFTIRTMDKNGPQQIFMAGSMGQGGRGAYALNLGGPKRTDGSERVGIDAPQNQWLNSVPLFETKKGTGNMMGYTIGTPQIGRLALNRTVNPDASTNVDYSDVRYSVFVGSGIRAPGQYQNGVDHTESALYVYNALKGTNVGVTNNASANSANLPAANSADLNSREAGYLIKKLAVPANIGSGGLAQPTIVDNDLDGIIDVAYAGDYNGGLYRFDLRGPVDQWSVHKIFQTDSNQPITSAPAVFRDSRNKYVVIFGTGSDFFQEDLLKKDRQSVYGIYDNLANFSPSVQYSSALVRQNVTASKFNGHDVRELTDNAMPNQNAIGWVFDLPTPGERVVVKPDMLLKTAMLITRNYTEKFEGRTQGDICSIEETERRSTSGESWIMQVKADNGGNLPGVGGDDAYAYADFLRQNKETTDANGNKVVVGRPDKLYSGVRNSDGLFRATLLIGSNDENVIGGLNNSSTVDGDNGRNGVDAPINAKRGNEDDPTEHCFQTDDNKLLGISSNIASGIDGQSVNIRGKSCTQPLPNIRRLSWREIF